jgi:hypothetical protein
MSAKRRRVLYQLKITLLHIEPPIWRRVQVWEDTKLPRLHKILQLLFNWEDYHLHEFVAGKRIYGTPEPDDSKPTDESDVPLNRLVDRVGDEFEYHYDFGDDWAHQLLLEAILLPETNAFYPRCIAGERHGPPEDVGGPLAYAEYLSALADPKHSEHEEKLAWRGPFNSEAFSVDEINALLRNAFERRAKTRLSHPE